LAEGPQLPAGQVTGPSSGPGALPPRWRLGDFRRCRSVS
jgi:hypothetical protein